MQEQGSATFFRGWSLSLGFRVWGRLLEGFNHSFSMLLEGFEKKGPLAMRAMTGRGHTRTNTSIPSFTPSSALCQCGASRHVQSPRMISYEPDRLGYEPRGSKLNSSVERARRPPSPHSPPPLPSANIVDGDWVSVGERG